MIKCPFCAEDINDDAIKCRYCGEFLNDANARSSTLTTNAPAGPDAHTLVRIGAVLGILGLIAAMYFFLAFDTSVYVPFTEVGGQKVGGGRVNNLELMSQRQNGIIIACAVAVIGLVILIGGWLSPRRRLSPRWRQVYGKPQHVPGGLLCPTCGLINPENAFRCDCGYRFLSQSRK